MKVYQKHTSSSPTPYLDNCYLSSSPLHQDDIDVTSTTSLFSFVPSNQIDYIEFRNYCKQELLPNWSNLPEEEKLNLIKHNIAPNETEKENRVSIEQHRINFFELIRLEKLAREKRWEKAKKHIAFEFRLNQLNQLLMYQDTKPFKDDYIDAELPYLIHWIASNTNLLLGIDFTNNGFSSKSYFDQNLQTKLLEILLENKH